MKGTRKAYFKEFKGFKDTAILSFKELLSGNVLEGPCIVEAVDTTLIVPPDLKGYVDEYRNLRIPIQPKEGCFDVRKMENNNDSSTR
jgi:N-methylhydantoinase A